MLISAKEWYFIPMKIFSIAIGMAMVLNAMGLAFEIAQANSYSDDVITAMSGHVANFTWILWAFVMYGFVLLIIYVFNYLGGLLSWRGRKK